MQRQQVRKIKLWGGLIFLLFILAACSNAEGNVPEAVQQVEKIEDNAAEAEVEVEEKAEDSKQTIQYTTITGVQIEIPKHPKKVIYLGDILGDFLAMDIPIIGNNLVHAKGRFYEGRIDGITDAGNPGDLELIMSLEPDLIINSYSHDENRNEALSKIAPTVPFNSALPYRERVTEIGNIFGKQEDAAAWIAKFEEKSQEMWDKLQLAEDETATVFLQLGKMLYVMGNRSLGAVLFEEKGFAIPAPIKKNIIDEGLTFATISEELLPEYAGDHLFVLVLDNDESQTEAERMLQSPIWKSVPAVQKGNVYIEAADWNTDGLLALEQLLEELPKWMKRP